MDFGTRKEQGIKSSKDLPNRIMLFDEELVNNINPNPAILEYREIISHEDFLDGITTFGGLMFDFKVYLDTWNSYSAERV